MYSVCVCVRESQAIDFFFKNVFTCVFRYSKLAAWFPFTV